MCWGGEGGNIRNWQGGKKRVIVWLCLYYMVVLYLSGVSFFFKFFLGGGAVVAI